MITRRVSHCRLRPEGLDENRQRPEAIWPEVLQSYRSAGVRSISCFFHGTQLIVAAEWESRANAPARRQTEVELRRAALMKPLAAPRRRTRHRDAMTAYNVLSAQTLAFVVRDCRQELRGGSCSGGRRVVSHPTRSNTSP